MPHNAFGLIEDDQPVLCGEVVRFTGDKVAVLVAEGPREACERLLAHLRSNGFKTFIVSGGGIEFMRPWTEQIYGVPPEQVVGSSGVVKFEVKDGKPVLMREPPPQDGHANGPAQEDAAGE